MNSNVFYEGSATMGTTSNGMMDVVFQCVAEHACRCDECKILDAKDFPLLALCRRYLGHEIDFDEFRDQHVLLTCTRSSDEVAMHRNFDRGSSDLNAAIEFCISDSEFEIDEDGKHARFGSFREKDFRIRLEGLVYGYEIRMRTVHFWSQGPI